MLIYQNLNPFKLADNIFKLLKNLRLSFWNLSLPTLLANLSSEGGRGICEFSFPSSL